MVTNMTPYRRLFPWDHLRRDIVTRAGRFANLHSKLYYPNEPLGAHT